MDITSQLVRDLQTIERVERDARHEDTANIIKVAWETLQTQQRMLAGWSQEPQRIEVTIKLDHDIWQQARALAGGRAG